MNTRDGAEWPNMADLFEVGFTEDADGNVVAFKAADGYFRFWTYDKNGKLMSTDTETDYYSDFKRDTAGNLLYWSNSLGMNAIFPKVEPVKVGYFRYQQKVSL